MKKKILFGIIGLVALIMAVFWASDSLPKVQGSAPGGYSTSWATSSVITLSQSVDAVLFATSTPSCTARTITTRARPLMVKFGDHAGFTLDSNTGHSIGASSTITYDAGEYGCGRWTGRNHGSAAADADAIVTEFRDFR